MGKKSRKEKEVEKTEALATNEEALQENKTPANESIAQVEAVISDDENGEVLDEKALKKVEKQAKKDAKKQAQADKEAEEIAKEQAKEDALKDKKSEKKAAKKAEKKHKEELKKLSNRPKWVKGFFKKNQGKTQERMFEYMNNDHDKLLQRANVLLEIKESDYQELFIIKMPDSYDNKKQVSYRLDYNKAGDQTLLYDQAYFNLLYFGKDVFYNYHANIDYNTGQIGNDGTIIFRYSDIVSIENKLVYDHVDHPKYLQFSVIVHLSNSQHISLNLRNQRLNTSGNLPGLLTMDEQRIVKLLKEKMEK